MQFLESIISHIFSILSLEKDNLILKQMKIFVCIFLLRTRSVSGSFKEKKLNSLGNSREEGTCEQFWKKEARNILKIGRGKPFSQLLSRERTCLPNKNSYFKMVTGKTQVGILRARGR